MPCGRCRSAARRKVPAGARKRRLEEKKQRGRLKSLRGKKDWDQ